MNRIPRRLRKLSTFLAFPVTSLYASDLLFPLATISANFACLEFRRTGITLPLFTASACWPCGVAAAYDEGCRFGFRRFLRGLADWFGFRRHAR